MTGDLYIQTVIDQIPSGMPLREQVAMELRGHIAERQAQGQSIEQIIRQLGDPLALAESYLAAIPLTNAPIGARLAAKIIDAGIVTLVMFTLAAAVWLTFGSRTTPLLPVIGILGSVFGFAGYTIYAEYRFGRTTGKRLMGIRVVRESGTRISLGQAWLRQLPFFFQFFFIDALFALFTAKHQRAFELITKTRAVAVLAGFLLLT
jgi:uncharacterized RDD family membrane protein YckC